MDGWMERVVVVVVAFMNEDLSWGRENAGGAS